MGDAAIPYAVCVVVGDVLSNYKSHVGLNALFAEAGAPGEAPEGNKADKVSGWLKRASRDSPNDALKILGFVLQEVMDVDRPTVFGEEKEKQAKDRDRINAVLTKSGLVYHRGGRISRMGMVAVAKALEDRIRDKDWTSVHSDFERTATSIDRDPAAAVASACSLLESICKVYLDMNKIEYPSKESLDPLWAVVQRSLGLDPASKEDDDIKKILSGLTSAAKGIAAFRTHASSAHGRGTKHYRTEPRHARLAVGAAHTLATFLIETWEARK